MPTEDFPAFMRSSTGLRISVSRERDVVSCCFVVGIALFLLSLDTSLAQQPEPLIRIEPGLEKAVKWKWSVSPSREADWGLALPEPPPPLPVNETPEAKPARDSADSYVVKKGDALILIAKRFDITVDQLKTANELTSNLIRIGDVLKIPTAEEIARMPVAVSAPALAAATPSPKVPDPSGFDPDVLLFQIFLDRQQFSPGRIDGKSGLGFQKLMFLYQLGNEEARDVEALRVRAQESVGPLFTSYTLRPEDFRFIAPPKAEKAPPPEQMPKTKPKKNAPPPVVALPVSYDELTGTSMLAYRSPWEFVAERFHCDEEFLRSLNPAIKTLPVGGTEFRVPNVVPFEIEKAFVPPLQPPLDPANPVTAVVMDLARLEVYRNEKLIAVFPLSSARPSLRGRGTWTILDAVPRPRLGTFQENREKPRPTSTFFVGENPAVAPETPVLAQEQFLAAGPNNPVGIIWINLSKSDSPGALPFGLHGTSIPDRMFVQESLGGFRLTNWDIARAVRLLPSGTPLHWKQSAAPTVQPASVQ